MQDSSVGAGTSGGRPKRTLKACDQCRKKKTKCDGVEPVCAVCAMVQGECSYKMQQRQRGPPKGWKRARTVTVPVDPPVAGSSRQTEETGADGAAASAGGDGLSPTSLLHDSFAYTTRRGMHFRGSSSGYALLGKASLDNAPVWTDKQNMIQLDDPSEASESGSEAANDIAITHQASLALLSSFFDNVYPSWPVLFPLAYESRTCTDLLSELQPSLLAAIQALAWGDIHQRSSQLELPPRSWFMKTAWNQIAQTWPIQSTIVAAQTLTLLSLASYGSGDYASAWTVCAMACSMAQHMGLHRMLPRHFQAGNIEREVRARVFWNIYMLDKVLALELGRNPFLQAKHCDAPLPSWEVDSPCPVFGTAGNLNLSLVPVINATFQSLQIAEEIIEVFYSLHGQKGLTEEPEAARAAAKRLIQKQSTITTSFERRFGQLPRSSAVSTQPPANLLAFAMGLNANTIMLHRAFIGEKAAYLDHLQVAADAAIELVEQLRLMAVHNFGSLASETLFLTFTAAVTLLLVLRESSASIENAASVGLETCISWLEEPTMGWPAAHAVGKLLRYAKATLPVDTSCATAEVTAAAAETQEELFNRLLNWNNIDDLFLSLSVPEDASFWYG